MSHTFTVTVIAPSRAEALQALGRALADNTKAVVEHPASRHTIGFLLSPEDQQLLTSLQTGWF